MRSSVVGIAAMCLAIFMLYSNVPVVATRMGLPPTVMAGVVLALMLFAAAHELILRRRSMVVDRTFLLIMLLLCVFIASTTNAVGYDVAIDRIIVFVTEGILVYFLVRQAIRSASALRVAMASMLVAAAFLATLATVQNVTQDYDQQFMGLAQRSFGDPNARSDAVNLEERAMGPVGEANRFAQILLMAAPIGFVLAKDARRRSRAIAAATCLLVVLGGVLLTYSRGAFLTLVVLMMLAVPMRLLRLRGLVLAGAGATLVMFLVVPGYVGRIVSIAGVADLLGGGPTTVEADGATRGRTTEMLAGIAAYVDHPIIGVGPGQYVTFHSQYYQSLPEISIRDLAVERRAHNLYIEMAAETGTVGLLVFLTIPFLLLRDLELLRRTASVTSPERARLAAAFALVVLAYLGTGVFLHLAFERYYWFMIGLTAAAIDILRREINARAAEPADPHFGEGSFVPRSTGGVLAC